MIKVGDKVRIMDFSYTLRFDNQRMEHINLRNAKWDTEYEVLFLGYKLPGAYFANNDIHPVGGNDVSNNVIIRELDTGRLVFIREKWLKPVEKYCETCGQKINKPI